MIQNEYIVVELQRKDRAESYAPAIPNHVHVEKENELVLLGALHSDSFLHDQDSKNRIEITMLA